ncbi:Heterokaryon incompatibility protein 6, OR allele [Fusarium oxysporum f. sp. albedinis]|nr:Heterokaryon incompatibility protein 6, OR allele [Fusarium oxysporum f. sp. albedinis]
MYALCNNREPPRTVYDLQKGCHVNLIQINISLQATDRPVHPAPTSMNADYLTSAYISIYFSYDFTSSSFDPSLGVFGSADVHMS